MGFGLVAPAVPGEPLFPSAPSAGLVHHITAPGDRKLLINTISLRQSINREEAELK